MSYRAIITITVTIKLRMALPTHVMATHVIILLRRRESSRRITVISSIGLTKLALTINLNPNPSPNLNLNLMTLLSKHFPYLCSVNLV